MQEEKIKYYIELIDKSLNGDVTDSQEMELKIALESNETLKKIAKEHLLAKANIRVAGEKELKKRFSDKFESLKETREKPQTNIQSSISYYFFAFVLVALVLAAMYFLNRNNKLQEPLNIAGNVSSIEDPSYDLLRSKDSSGMEISWDTAIQQFATKNYNETLISLKGLSVDSTFLSKHSGKYYLMKGVSFMKLEQYVESENELTKINTENPYYDQAEWYLALNYFYNNQEDKAIKRFNLIKNNPTHYKRTIANNYLEALKSN